MKTFFWDIRLFTHSKKTDSPVSDVGNMMQHRNGLSPTARHHKKRKKGRKEKTWNLKNFCSDTVYGNLQSTAWSLFPGIGSPSLLGSGTCNNLSS